MKSIFIKKETSSLEPKKENTTRFTARAKYAHFIHAYQEAFSKLPSLCWWHPIISINGAWPNGSAPETQRQKEARKRPTVGLWCYHIRPQTHGEHILYWCSLAVTDCAAGPEWWPEPGTQNCLTHSYLSELSPEFCPLKTLVVPSVSKRGQSLQEPDPSLDPCSTGSLFFPKRVFKFALNWLKRLRTEEATTVQTAKPSEAKRVCHFRLKVHLDSRQLR